MKRIIQTLLLALCAMVCVWAADEVLHFVLRSIPKAQEEATQDFIWECKRRSFESSEFVGPTRIMSPPKTYGFIWVNPSNGNQIVTMVSYLPSGVESWLSNQKDQKFVPYCKDLKNDCSD